jgi:hypothetical protein
MTVEGVKVVSLLVGDLFGWGPNVIESGKFTHHLSPSLLSDETCKGD